MEDQILYESIYIKCPEKVYLYRQKVDQQFPRVDRGWGVALGENEATFKVQGDSFGTAKCSKSDCGRYFTIL